MSEWTLIMRADDLGSSRSANRAIRQVTDAGFVKNVSIMACGPYVEEAAQMLAGRKDICFGMHTTLNAEWDKVKWGPVSGLKKDCGLLDEQGYFLNNPVHFLETKPAVECIMQEVSAQLDKLVKLGFDIRYIDSHMFSELYVEGMDAAMEDFIRRKGIVDHMYFYHYLPEFRDLTVDMDRIQAELGKIREGHYLYVSHPSLDTEEMRMTGNADVRGELVAKGRASETNFFSSFAVKEAFEKMGCSSIRYDEAPAEKRLTIEDLKKELENRKNNRSQ